MPFRVQVWFHHIQIHCNRHLNQRCPNVLHPTVSTLIICSVFSQMYFPSFRNMINILLVIHEMCKSAHSCENPASLPIFISLWSLGAVSLHLCTVHMPTFTFDCCMNTMNTNFRLVSPQLHALSSFSTIVLSLALLPFALYVPWSLSLPCSLSLSLSSSRCCTVCSLLSFSLRS